MKLRCRRLRGAGRLSPLDKTGAAGVDCACRKLQKSPLLPTAENQEGKPPEASESERGGFGNDLNFDVVTELIWIIGEGVKAFSRSRGIDVNIRRAGASGRVRKKNDAITSARTRRFGKLLSNEDILGHRYIERSQVESGSTEKSRRQAATSCKIPGKK